MTCQGGRLVLCCCWNKSPTKKLEMRRLYLVSAGRNLYVRTLFPDTYVPGISRLPRYVYDTRYVDTSTRYVCTWYQPATQIRMYLVSAGRRAFHPWTHTSDDSYMYQLSLVVATATVFSNNISKVSIRYPTLIWGNEYNIHFANHILSECILFSVPCTSAV